jgi:hypothetical protein
LVQSRHVEVDVAWKASFVAGNQVRGISVARFPLWVANRLNVALDMSLSHILG